MRPQEGEIKHGIVSSFDIENDKDSKTTVCGYVDPDGKYHAFDDEGGFVRYIAGHYRKDEVCFAHNGSGFDFQRLIGPLASQGVWFRWILQGGKLIAGNAVKQKGGLRFSDSALLYRQSLKELGKDLGLEKEGDFESEGEELERYNERDCRIVIEAMRRLQVAADKLGFAVKPTPAGCSLDYIRRHMGGHIFLPQSEAFGPAYFGGRVLLLQPEYEGEGFCADVNSLYPWAMCQSLPLGEPTIYSGPFGAAEARKLIGESVGFARCRVKLHPRSVPPLPVLGKARIVYPTGEFDGLWAFPDLMSLDEDDKIWIREAIVFREARPWLRDIISHLYGLRKTTKNPAEKAALKILLNAGYGKTAEKKDKTDLSLEGEVIVPVRSGGKVWLVGKNHKEVEPPARSPATAAYITAWSRRRWSELFGAHQERCLYLDTDSAYLPGKPGDYPSLPFDDELGNLKVEARFDKFSGLAPKVYGYRYAQGEKDKSGGEIGGQWGVRAKGFPMGGSWHEICGDGGRREIWTDRAGVLGMDYKRDGGTFLARLRSGMSVHARRPVSFALAGRQNVSPGTWVTLSRDLRSGADSGRLFSEDWRRTVAPDASEVERRKWTGETFDEDLTEEGE